MQTFFLAVQEKGYFVLNDIFRYLEPPPQSAPAPAAPTAPPQQAPIENGYAPPAAPIHQPYAQVGRALLTQENASPARQIRENAYALCCTHLNSFSPVHFVDACAMHDGSCVKANRFPLSMSVSVMDTWASRMARPLSHRMAGSVAYKAGIVVAGMSVGLDMHEEASASLPCNDMMSCHAAKPCSPPSPATSPCAAAP